MTDQRDSHPDEMLSAYLDGELADRERAGVEAHVAECASCSALVDDFQAIAATATREQPPPVPGDLRARVRMRIAEWGDAGGLPGRRVIGFNRLGLAASAGIVLAIGLWTTLPRLAPRVLPPLARRSTPDSIGESDRARIEQGAPTQPGAPAKPGDAMSRREPGYGGDEARPKRNSPPTAEGSLGAASSDRKMAARTQAQAFESAPRPEAVVPRAQVLLLEYPTCRVSVHPDGTIVLTAEGYDCAVQRQGPSVDPDITALFVLASAAGETANAPPAPRRAAAVVRLLEPDATGGEAGGGVAGIDLPAGTGMEVETRLRKLLGDRYLALMERRCGPLPRGVLSP